MPSRPLPAQYGEPGPEYDCASRGHGAVPAEGEQAAFVRGAVVDEVAHDAGGGAAQPARG